MRKSSGSLLILIGAFFLIAVIVGIIIAWMVILFGGFRESQNAVDAGSLSLAKQVSVNPVVQLRTDGAESVFVQVAEKRNQGWVVNLNNINRLAAQLLLIDANCSAMEHEKTSGQAILAITRPLHNALESIQGRLAEQLAARANVIPYYENIANQNSVRMLQSASNNDIRVYQTDYRVAYVDRGGPANVHVQDNQIPQSFMQKWQEQRSNWAVSVSGDAEPRYYLRGYTNDISPLNNKDIFFVTLKESGSNSLQEIRTCQPHLISQTTIQQNKDTGTMHWAIPVPNAFGITMNTGTKYVDPLSSTPSSSVVISLRPTEGYYAQIPHGFIRIRNLPPQNVSFNSDTPHNDDVFNYIAHTPVEFAEGPTNRHYQKSDDKFIQNILTALKNRQLPKTVDYESLKQPASLKEAMQVTKESDKIDNHSYKQFPPQVPQEIGDAFKKYVPNAGTSKSDQLHCYEAACFALLAARSTGANGDPFSLSAGMSGIAKFQPQRSPLGANQKKFTKSMTLSEIFSNANSDVAARLKERCYQILPTFSGNLSDISGWNSIQIQMGQTLYIYWDGTLNEQTGRPEGTLRLTQDLSKAPWIASEQNVPPEGKPAAIDCNILPIAPQGNGGLDLKGDWSYEMPFDRYKGDKQLIVRNIAMFLPASGVNDLLGEIDLAAQFGATAQDDFGNQPGFTTYDMTKQQVKPPQPLKVSGTYSGPS